MTEKQPQFLFLYPQEEYFDFDIGNGAFSYYAGDKEFQKAFIDRLKKTKTKTEKNAIEKEYKQVINAGFRNIFSEAMNRCIDLRYRQNGFMINFIVFKDSKVSDVIKLRENDRIFEADVDFKTHCAEKKYANPRAFLRNFKDSTNHLRICGYHIWDCVEKTARTAHRMGFDVLVDEDLTELFEYRIRQPGFKFESYPSFNPRTQRDGECYLRRFLEGRKGKPWLWQKY